VRRLASLSALFALWAALASPVLAAARPDDRHAGCSCPVRACFCAHGKAAAGESRSCSTTLAFEAMGCGRKPQRDARLGPTLPDLELAELLSASPLPVHAPSADPPAGRIVCAERAVDPPPPKV
jgi:hypothetical protein